MNITPKSMDSLRRYINALCTFSRSREDDRYNMELVDREYARQNFRDAEGRTTKILNERRRKKILDDVVVPVLFPQVESMHAYMAGVFLSGYPIFSAVAAPEHSEAIKMMDAVNAAHSIKAKWAPNLAKAFRDGLKYNKMCVEVVWNTKKSLALQSTAEGIAPKATVWEGNSIVWHSMYNTFYDPRVEIANVHEEGEYAGYTEIMSKVKFKMFLEDLNPEHRMRNFKEALECGTGPSFYYVPEVTDKMSFDAMQTRLTGAAGWLQDAPQKMEKRINYRDIYEVITMYVRLIPEEHGLQVPQSATPQIWKLILVNGSVLIYAEKLSNAHNMIPMVFGAPYEDGLGSQTLSFAENLLETQGMSSALWNIKLNSARRNVTDRGIYNPEYISEADINSSNPSAKIPLRRNKFLDDIRKAYFPIPYDPSAANAVVQDAAQIVDMGRSISGISKPFEGQFLKGNRTLGEYEDIRGNADARSQTMALFVQAQFLEPVKNIIKSNVLQYVKPDAIYFSKAQQSIGINPQAMQDAALDYKLSDGLLPTNKIADLNFLGQLLNAVTTNPEIQAQFDVVKVMAYIGALGNAPDLDSFRRDATPQQATPSQLAATSQQPQSGVL